MILLEHAFRTPADFHRLLWKEDKGGKGDPAARA